MDGTGDHQPLHCLGQGQLRCLAPYTAAGRHVNYLGDDEPGNPVAAAYGPNYPRLQKIKAKYDPRNIFHMNLNILPASA